MAHELDFSTGRAAIALVGGADSAWHGLGQTIEPGDTLDEIAVKAGLDWTAHKAAMLYRLPDGTEKTVDNSQVVYRSDTGEAIGKVSTNRYNIVQPKETLEFFRDFVSDNGLQIETARALKGGRTVWALASLGPDFDYISKKDPKDVTRTFARFQTSFDGSRVSSLVQTSIRQVCANTEAAIERATDGTQYRVPHCRELNMRDLQAAFGLMGEQHRLTVAAWETLQETAVTDEIARQYFLDVLGVKAEDVDRLDVNGKPVISTKQRNQLQALAVAYKRGPGSHYKSADGTAYGLLNAVTRVVDHESIVRDSYGDGAQIARLSSAWIGSGAALKEKARGLALALAA